MAGKKKNNTAASGPSGASPEDEAGILAAQNIARDAGDAAANMASKAGATDDAAQDIGTAAAEAAGQSTLKETGLQEIPRLKNFRFKLRESQYLKGLENFRTYFNMYDAAKEAAGWTPGTPIHPLDDRLLGYSIMCTSTGVALSLVQEFRSASEMINVLKSQYEPGLEEYREIKYDEFHSYKYDGGDPVVFNTEWIKRKNASYNAGNRNPTVDEDIIIYLTAIRNKEPDWTNTRRLWMASIPSDQRLAMLQGGLASNFSNRIGKSSNKKDGKEGGKPGRGGKSMATSTRINGNCHSCGKYGHRAVDCRSDPKSENYQGAQSQQNAQFTTEAEYYAVNEGAREAAFIRNMLEELDLMTDGPIPLLVDNTGAESWSKQQSCKSSKKHVRRYFHYVQQEVLDNNIVIRRVPSEDNAADGLTKALAPKQFERFVQLLGMVD